MDVHDLLDMKEELVERYGRAVDLIEKPFREQVLLDAITHAVRNGETVRRQCVEHAATRKRLKRLMPREYEVLNLIIDGKQNKGIAAALGLSHKTVESHRTRIMKMQRTKSGRSSRMTEDCLSRTQ